MICYSVSFPCSCGSAYFNTHPCSHYNYFFRQKILYNYVLLAEHFWKVWVCDFRSQSSCL